VIKFLADIFFREAFRKAKLAPQYKPTKNYVKKKLAKNSNKVNLSKNNFEKPKLIKNKKCPYCDSDILEGSSLPSTGTFNVQAHFQCSNHWSNCEGGKPKKPSTWFIWDELPRDWYL
tara:strand:+ start:119 stop:469 length:351 start_codon:yes stop_codon:yes gene_type:complete